MLTLLAALVIRRAPLANALLPFQQCPRHSAQSWRSHLNKNRLPYTQTAREMWRLQQAGTQESGDEQSEDEDEDEAEEEAEAEAVLGGEKADKPAEEQGSGEIRADTAKTAEIAAPVQ